MITPQNNNAPRSLWERACSRWDRRGLSGTPSGLHREQARSHTGYALCALALAVGLSGCAGLPDQRLANEALDSALAGRPVEVVSDRGPSLNWLIDKAMAVGL